MSRPDVLVMEALECRWADREWVYACFDKMHLEPWQRLNHFRNGRELCRKDLMAKNIKRQRRALEKENRCDYCLCHALTINEWGNSAKIRLFYIISPLRIYL